MSLTSFCLCLKWMMVHYIIVFVFDDPIFKRGNDQFKKSALQA